MELSIPKGTRDFLPNVVRKREYIFNTIENVFKLYGYQPIETPTMENLSILLGKYGEEGDRLIFKILNSGNFLEKLEGSITKDDNYNKISCLISEKGLRYDLTVPFARFVVMHRNEIEIPFKRYQIQPVFRADRPQKGRYREFYQCDVDIIGSNSLLNEVELILIIDDVFKKLNCNVVTKINNRKLLTAISEFIEERDRFLDLTVIIDKIEKIGIEGVEKELKEKQFKEKSISKLKEILFIEGNNIEKIQSLKSLLSFSNFGQQGIQELEEIFYLLENFNVKNEVEFDITLARGLNYYTGTIFEVKSKDITFGSLCGGGRYDDLTGIFGMHGLSGVGISFGADRIYDILNELNLFPPNIEKTTDVMFVNFGQKEISYCIESIQLLRNNNVSCEIYPDVVKLKKQLSYANDKKIKWVVIAGEEEIKENVFTVKNLNSGEQIRISKNSLLEYLMDQQNQ